MKRFNGKFRDHEKVIRDLKKTDSQMISSYQIYHNYIRPHMALDGKAPAEVCGVRMKGETSG